MSNILQNHGLAVQEVHRLAAEVEQLEADLKRLWHFAGCPFDHCETCITDAEWIKSLHERLGAPSDKAVMAQRAPPCPGCGEPLPAYCARCQRQLES